MIKEAIEKILSLGAVEQIQLGPLTFTSKGLHALQAPLAEKVDVTTLSGLEDLLESQLDGLVPSDLLLHVVDHEDVELISRKADDWGRRRCIAKAIPLANDPFKFGQYMGHEEFIVGVQSHFTDAGDRDYLIKIASSITNEKVTTSEDNGIAQKVGLRAGVTLQSTEVLKPRVTLSPFRTFLEVQQPASEFIFRARQQGDAVPQLGLWEADGGKWKLTAMQSIADWLAKNTKVEVIA